MTGNGAAAHAPTRSARDLRGRIGALLLVSAGAVLGLTAGLPLAFDLAFDEYPDTLLDHPLEAALVLTGLVAIGAGGLLFRRASPRFVSSTPAAAWGRAASGLTIIAIAAVSATVFTALCAFGCSRTEYWIGIAGFSALAAAGVALVSVAPRHRA